MTRTSRLSVAGSAAALFLFITVSYGQENYSTWSNHQTITLNTSVTGANIAGNVIRFPVLVRLNPANFSGFAQTLAAGADVRFSKTNYATHLPYQIERWVDGATDTAEIWVLVDTVFGNGTTTIVMHYGKAGSVDSSKSTAVFDTANGFRGVWHLNNNFTDATIRAGTGISNGTVDTAGVISHGRKFNGANRDSIQVAGLMGNPTVVTISCWTKVDSIDAASNCAELVSIGNNAALRVARNAAAGRDSLVAFYHYNNNWNNSVQAVGGANLFLKAGWKHVAYVCNPAGTSQRIFVNGAQVGTNAFTNALYYTGQGANTIMGKHGGLATDAWYTYCDFGGVLDEVRIERLTRSADWVKLCYQNQRMDSTKLVWLTVPAAPVLALPANTATGVSQYPTLSWNAVAGAATYRVQASTISTFTSTVCNDSTVSTTSRPIGPLSSGTVYYWRVNAKNAAGTGSWSAVWSFTILTENYATWLYNRNLIINTAAADSGANVATDQYNFPLLVRLNPAVFCGFGQTLAGGADIRFAKSNGTPLPYEIERWVNGGGNNDTAVIWVRVDTVKGNNASQYIVMYWGKAGAASQSNAKAVFEAANGFQGVWHFAEATGAAAVDATSNGYNGTPYGTTMPTDTMGIIGKAKVYNGTTGYFAMNGTASSKLNFPEDGTYTLSTWVNADALNAAFHEILSKGDNQYALKLNTRNTWELAEFDNTAGWQWVESAAVAGAWKHVVGVRNGANAYLYIDGVLATSTLQNYGATGRITTFNLNIGKWPNTAERFFDGKIDEIELSNVSRSADWVKLSYENQKLNATMAKFVGILGVPSLTLPGAGAVDSVPSVTLTWGTVTNAMTYHAQLSTSSTFSTTVANDSTLTVGSLAVSGLTAGTTYYWRVKARSTSCYGNSAWSTPVRSFSTLSLPGTPTLASPASGSTGQAITNLPLSWNTATATLTYTLQVSTISTFASFVYNQGGLTALTQTCGGLLNSTQYFWRVQGTNAFGTGSFSSIWNFTTILTPPGTPVLTAPADGATGVAVAPTLTWGTVATAATYRVQVSTVSTFASFVVNDATPTTGSLAVSGLTASTQYFWRVNATNAGGTGGWSTMWSFTTIAPPGQPALTAPANGAPNVALSPTLTWGTVATAATYRVQVSLLSTFATTVVNDATPTTGSLAVTGLTAGTQYFWRVNATNAGGTGIWSAIWNFTTVPPAPAAPTLVSPADGANNVSLNPTLTWNTVATAVTYRVQVSTVSTFASFVVDDATPTTGSRAVSGLTAGTTYYWRVNATNAGGTGAWSAMWNFVASSAPTAPTLVSPANNATNVALAPTLTWGTVATADSYRVQVSLLSTFASTVLDDSAIIAPATSRAVTGLTASTTYYWRVNAKNAAGTGAWSLVWGFATVPPAPGQPTLSAPADLSTNITVSPALSWSAVTGATYYHAQVSTVSTFATTVLDDTAITLSSRTAAGLANNTTHWWRVNARNAGGTSAWSSVWSFTTAIMPAAPVLTAPANLATNVALSPTLTWGIVTGATTYRVQVSTVSTFATTVVNDATPTTGSRAVTGLTAGTPYYWRVNATGNGGTGPWSAVWSFTTIPPPPVPVLALPASGSTNQAVSLNLSWNTSTGATSYALQVSTVSTFASTVYNQGGLTALTQAVGPLANSTTYYWRVNATNAGGTSAWSAPWNFATVLAPPAVPTLATPASGATGIALAPTLTWGTVATAVTYRVQVSTVSTFASFVVDDATPTTGSRAVSGLLGSTTYYWRVNATNAGGTSAWSSPVWSFTTLTPPAAPALTSPTNAQANVLLAPTLQWNTAATATSYHVQLSTDSTFATTFLNDPAVAVNSRAVTGLAVSTTYYWRVNATNAAGTGAWSTRWSFTTVPPAPGTPILATPANDTLNQPIAFNATWNAASGATTYTLQIATVSTFATTVINQGSIAATSQSVSGLANSTQHYWRVNASNAGGTSGWSAVWNFTTIIDTPGTPTLTAPANLATNVPLSPTLQWVAVAGAVSYRVQASAVSTFATMVFDDTLISTTQLIGPLAASTAHYWRVNAKNIGGISPWSAVRSFTTVPPAPGVPSLTAPANNATGQAIALTLTWGTVATATSYRVQLSTDSTFATTVVNDSAPTSGSRAVTGLANSQTYYWRVNAKNPGGTSAWSLVWHFATIIALPGTPVLVSPANNAPGLAINPLLVWNKASGALTYHLQVSTISTFTSFAFIDSSLTDTSRTIGPLGALTQYFWRVRAKNPAGVSAWSTLWNFTTSQAPGAPTLVSPANAAINIALSPAMTWNASATATSYTLQVSTVSTFLTTVVNQSGLTALTQTVGPLAANAVHYWRVSATNGAGTSAWSAAWSFTTISSPPPTPTLLSPTDGAGGQATSLTLRWNVAAGAVSYTLNVATASDFLSGIVLNQGGITADSLPVSGLSTSATYYWRVMATNTAGSSGWSIVWDFSTTFVIPSAPLLAAPLNNAVQVPVNQTLQWNASTGATYYRVQVSTDFTFATINDSLTLTALSRSLSGLENNRIYYWRVLAGNAAGTSAWSTLWNFTTVPETYSAWTYHKNFIVNTTAAGANVAAAAYNFPLLLRLNPGNFGWFRQTKPGGADIRFTKADNVTALPYEIERWVDAAADSLDTAELWVRLDTVLGNNASQYIIMHWGNAAATSRSSPAGVFDTLTGYSAAWHMNELLAGADTIVKNRTLDAYHGRLRGGMAAANAVAGLIGRGLTFDGSANYLQLDTIKANLSAGLTVSGWVWYRGLNSNSRIIDAGRGAASDNILLGNNLATNTLRWSLLSGAAATTLDSANYILTGTWMHVAATYSGSAMTIYKNGLPSSTRAATAALANVNRTAGYMARSSVTGDGLYNGLLDEMEVSKTARSAPWIKLAYETQKIGSGAICYPPSISVQPHDTTVAFADTARFSVTSRGNYLTYLWQRSIDGLSWSTAPGTATNAQYKFLTSGSDTSAVNPPRFRCIVSSCNYSETSSAAVLTVCVPTVVMVDPSPVTAYINTLASFSVTARGRGLTYLWQRSDNGGSTWAPAPGTATNATYSFTAAAADSVSPRFRCVVSGMCASQATSASATLTLCYTVAITTQPVNKNVTAGVQDTFRLVATGRNLQYEWYRKRVSESVFGPLSTNNPAYVFSAVADDNGAMFYCNVSTASCGTARSDTVTLSVCTLPAITLQPRDDTTTVGLTATLQCRATGSTITYRWQWSLDTGKTWADIIPAATDSNYSFVVTAGNSGVGVPYRCIVTGGCGSPITSNIARIGPCFTPQIAQQPRDTAVISGEQATFAVIATGTNLIYQWQRQNKGSTQWINLGTASPAATFYTFAPAPAADDSAHFRCLITGDCGSTTSGAALLVVWTPVAISAGPDDTTVTGGGIVRLGVIVTGTSPTFAWYKSRDNGTSWTAIPGNTTALCSFTSDMLDTNALVRCIVTGHYDFNAVHRTGIVTSRSARLALCYRPVITSQPSGQLDIPPGQSAMFRTSARGVGPVLFQWQKSIDNGTNWTSIPANGTDSSYSLIATLGDDNTLFRCRIAGSVCTSDTQLTGTALLTVCLTPTVTLQPVNQNVIEGQTTTFSIGSQGTLRTFRWQRKNNASSTWDTAKISGVPAIADLCSFTTIMADSGARFRCIVTGKCGADTSDSAGALLVVYHRASADFRMSDVNPAGPWSTAISNAGPLTVYFKDTSSVDVAQWYWNFGDGADTTVSNAGNQLHTYAAVTGMQTYTVKLRVAGNGGTDSLTRTVVIYNADSAVNPLRCTGRYLKDSVVELTLTGYAALRYAGVTPYVGSVRLWSRAGLLPVNPDPPDTNSHLQRSYTLAALKARGAQYVDTIHGLPPLRSPYTDYGFMTQIAWNNANTTPFAPVNGFSVYMRDTVRPVNSLALSIRYAPRDTVSFYLDNTTAIDTAAADSIALWFGLGADSVPDFTLGNPDVIWWTTQQILAADSAGRFTYMLKDPRFNTEPTPLTIAVRMLGKNNLWNDKRITVSVGRPRPVNTITLHADTINASSIRLSWNQVTGMDSIRVVYRTGSEVPLDCQFDTAFYTVLTLNPADTAALIRQLNPLTTYYFGAQVYHDGLWSYVTDSSRTSITTNKAGSSTIQNTITITAVRFDTASNRIWVYWQVDTTVAPAVDLSIGINGSIYNVAPDSAYPADRIIQVTGTRDSASFLPGGIIDSLRFDTTFYVYLRLMKSGEYWTDPVAASMTSCQVPPFVWQEVHWDVLFSTQPQTTYWANTMVRFVAPPTLYTNDVTHTTGIIRAFTPATTAMDGFVPTGTFFYFVNNYPVNPYYPLSIGLKCAVPSGYSLRDVRIYRYNAADQTWMVERLTAFDSANAYVYITTSDLSRPFAAMIDTMPPTLTLLNSRVAAVPGGTVVIDSVRIQDNISNCIWTFRSTKGGDPYTLPIGDSTGATLTTATATARVSIAARFVSEDNGARAIIFADDGRFRDTLSLSQAVIRDSNNVLYSGKMMWTPLKVTAVLDSPSTRRILRFVDTLHPAAPTYDNRYVRIFRFYQDAANATEAENKKWLEYSVPRDNIFALTAGKLMWIKTRNEVRFDFGRGVTMSLDTVVAIPLTTHGWTDVAVPYQYDMRLGDIVTRTRTGSPGADTSFAYYRWVRDGAFKYHSELIYDSTLAGTGQFGGDSLAAILGYSTFDGFTVYSRHNGAATLNLRIPPVSAAMSPFTTTPAPNAKKAFSKKAARKAAGWTVKIAAKAADGSVLSPVYCGYDAAGAGAIRSYPLPPSFEGLSAGICDEKSGALNGFRVFHAMKNGCSYLIAFRNDRNDTTGAARLSFRLDRSGSFPPTLKTAVFNAITGELVTLSGAEETALEVAPLTSEFRWLFVGDDAYIAAAASKISIGKLALDRIFPNPIRSFVRLRYTIPFARVGSVEFSVYDIAGRIVWRTAFKNGLAVGGSRECLWNATNSDGRRVASGLYIVRMAAFDQKNKLIGAFQRKLTVLP